MGCTVSLAAAVLLVGVVLAVPQDTTCATEPQTGVPEDNGTQMGGASPDKSQCPPPSPPPDPCAYDYACYPCVYPMDAASAPADVNGTNDTSASVPTYFCDPCSCYYPCAYQMDGADTASGDGSANGSDASMPIYYCPPCYYLDTAGAAPSDANGSTDTAGSDIATYDCGCYCPPPPCYYDAVTDSTGSATDNGTGDAGGGTATGTDSVVICPMPAEPAA